MSRTSVTYPLLDTRQPRAHRALGDYRDSPSRGDVARLRFTQIGCMGNSHTLVIESSATYEIRLLGGSVQALQRQFPSITAVMTRQAHTVLFRRVEAPAELDQLLDQLLSMGLVLAEVHEVPVIPLSAPPPEPVTSEGTP